MNGIWQQFIEYGAVIAIFSAILKYFFSMQEKNAEARMQRIDVKLDDAGVKLVSLQLAMERKLDTEKHDEGCDKKTEGIWQRVNKHCHDAQGNVIIPRI